MATPDKRRMYFSRAQSRQIDALFGENRREMKWQGREGSDDGRARERHIRIARTTTSTEHPTYPPPPANAFVIEFGETEFTETPGLRELTFTPYDPEEKRVAMDLNCQYHKEGEIVFTFLNHDQWFIIGGIQQVLAWAELTEDLCDQTTSIDVANAELLPYCTDFTPTDVRSSFGRRAPLGAKVLMVRVACQVEEEGELVQCAAGSEYWDIIAVQARPLCLVQGIEDRTSCLVAAGWKIAGEWCRYDEPIVACKIVDYIDCNLTLPPCNQVWVPTPLYACCGQGITGGSGSGGSGESGQAAAQGSSNARHPGRSPGYGFVSGRFIKTS